LKQRNTSDLSKRKLLSDIRGQISTIETHLQSFREICEVPRPGQHNHHLRQIIQDKFDFLVNDLEQQILNEK